jgi:uncharacterized protein YjbI with pentapeptide repeats
MSVKRFEHQTIGENDFSLRTFSESTAFVECVFPSKTTFRGCIFEGDVTFEGCRFLDELDFSESQFFGNFATNAEFLKTVYFDRSVFHKETDFASTHFCGDAYLRYVEFKWDVSFASARFDTRLNLRGCQFGGYADFSDVICEGRVKLLGAIFHDEVRLRNAQLRYLKNLVAHGVSLDGAILKEAHFHGISELRNYSFRNAFLLSCSLADKVVTDCDFTGAVFKAVLVDGWKPDAKTLANTKYIYTDYDLVKSDSNARSMPQMSPRPESRVPLVGEFGVGDHELFTLSEFLASRSSWQISIDLPESIRTAVLNYLNFFPDFIRLTDNTDVEVRSRREGGRLRIEFVSGSSIGLGLIQERLEQYLGNVGRPMSGINLEFRTETTSDIQKDLFLIRYEHQINTLRTELKYVERLLLKEEEKNRQLLELVQHLGRAPQQLLIPPKRDRFEVDVYFLTADLQGYSSATRSNAPLYDSIQKFLLDAKEKVSNCGHCELVKLEGDCIKVFSRDGVELIWFTRDIMHQFERLKKESPIQIDGFRAVLGYGHCIKEVRVDGTDFAGDCIIDTVRVDQPMKQFLKENGLPANQIWCTEAFNDALQGRHDNIEFRKLPPLSLEKNHPSSGDLFSITIR